LSPWLIVLILCIPALGGLAVGLILWKACPEVGGGGTTEILQSYHQRRAMMGGRVVPFKWLASCITIGTGGSGGVEGPVAQIGAATGSWLAQTLGLSDSERGLLFTAGIAGGIGAVFRAPLGGALFACEMYYSNPELEDEAVVPSLIASVSAYFVFGLIFGFQSLLPGDSQLNLSLANFASLGFLALLCALVARAYVGWLDVCSKGFKKVLPMPWRPGLGGLLTGAVALGLTVLAKFFLDGNAKILAVLGEGYPILDSAVIGTAVPLLLVSVLVGKLLTSGLTVGSGGSTGVFAPSMIIGGCLGGLVSTGMAGLGFAEGSPKGYVLAGMAAFFVAGTACPLASLVIITEVAQGYHLLPLLMWVVAIGYLLRRRPGLFRAQVPGSVDSPVHQAELEAAFLRSRRVGQVCRSKGIVASLAGWRSLGSVYSISRELGQRFIPVIGRDGRYLGAMNANDHPKGVLAQDLIDPSVPFLTADQDLASALKVIKKVQANELAVVDENQQLVGLFGPQDLATGLNAL
jgi:CIC family chloride channel protein